MHQIANPIADIRKRRGELDPTEPEVYASYPTHSALASRGVRLCPARKAAAARARINAEVACSDTCRLGAEDLCRNRGAGGSHYARRLAVVNTRPDSRSVQMPTEVLRVNSKM